ncbi:hypothetical protein [Pseudomonas carnis]|uniref:hypothetical protein n=1 Tax=Pseudomonas carnis TaxID=2487355 RepID=UPI001E58AF82|nr:hypothetical protein [Pseudomonas carnis]
MINDQKIIEAINSHGSDILNISCILSGLIEQLKKSQGPEGVEAARDYAVTMAKSFPAGGPTRPDAERISGVFNQHK